MIGATLAGPEARIVPLPLADSALLHLVRRGDVVDVLAACAEASTATGADARPRLVATHLALTGQGGGAGTGVVVGAAGPPCWITSMTISAKSSEVDVVAGPGAGGWVGSALAVPIANAESPITAPAAADNSHRIATPSFFIGAQLDSPRS
jgi:hypothetical protein